MELEQPWKPADATRNINAIAQDARFTPSYRMHAKERMKERDLLIGDVLHVLSRGHVLDDPESATQPGLFKYRVQSRTPNSGNRTVRVVAIPDPVSLQIKIVTVMWVDE